MTSRSKGRSASVSYTHLDVYKRQAWEGSAREAEEPTRAELDDAVAEALSLIHI